MDRKGTKDQNTAYKSAEYDDVERSTRSRKRVGNHSSNNASSVHNGNLFQNMRWLIGEILFVTDCVECQFGIEAVVDCINLDEKEGVIQAHQNQERPVQEVKTSGVT